MAPLLCWFFCILVVVLQCARFPVVASIPTPTYGWSGLTCTFMSEQGPFPVYLVDCAMFSPHSVGDTPDCPSGCSGRGTCTVTVGVARPYCVCNSVYAGVSCERYNLTDTAVLGIIGADNDTPEMYVYCLLLAIYLCHSSFSAATAPVFMHCVLLPGKMRRGTSRILLRDFGTSLLRANLSILGSTTMRF